MNIHLTNQENMIMKRIYKDLLKDPNQMSETEVLILKFLTFKVLLTKE